MNPSNSNVPAYDLLLENSNEWLIMNAWKKKHPNNNLKDAEYLIALAQYYPYGPNYYVFGGLFKIERIIPEVFDQIGYKLELQDDYKTIH
jgi:hypothetical protein